MFLASTLALAVAVVIVRQAGRDALRPCESDVVSVKETPSEEDLRTLPPGPVRSSGGKNRIPISPILHDGRPAPVAGLALAYSPIHYRGEEVGPEVGWASASLLDPTSCSKTSLVLDPAKAFGGPVTVWYDDSHDVYVAVARDRPGGERWVVLATFRRIRPPSGLVQAPPRWGNVLATLVLALATPILLFGLLRMLWPLREAGGEQREVRAPGLVPLVLSLALSALAMTLSRWV
ncbi:MAG: hypothetical protein QM820_11345 [Minicystis sp.]